MVPLPTESRGRLPAALAPPIHQAAASRSAHRSPQAPSRIAVILGTSPRVPPEHGQTTGVIASDIHRLREDQDANPPTNNIPAKMPASVRQSQPSTTDQPRRRGRPVGWRPGMGSYRAMPSLPRDVSSAGEPRKRAPVAAGGNPRRRGRPPKPGTQPPQAIYEHLRPKYISFICEWEGCPAELQNLGTLRKHVRVVHGRSGTCRWGKCAHAAHPQVLLSSREFERHVETAHMLPFAWHFGDGPRNNSAEGGLLRANGGPHTLPSYLLDDQGNQVTPSILNQEFENEEERKLRRRRLHRLLLERDRNAPEEEPVSPTEQASLEGGSIFRHL